MGQEALGIKNNLTVFHSLIQDQFAYGGKKYASTSQEKEATDILFENHGHSWLVGTIDKYTFRFKNLQRERDLLKVATYMYIIWLKRGFYLSSKGYKEALSTNVNIKTSNFQKFIGFFESYMNTNDYLTSMEVNAIIQLIHEQMCIWSQGDWEELTEENIYEIYNLTYTIWNKLYSNNAGADRDTWNEETKS